ncbi:uncharacterized protein MONBRDRAFT_33770 [Monosiga brevicollis MX1]|uniref:SEC7 domain-containing protein n=1 Tax=Monosiga brevicollis TaxID=81824 RepID=A9V7D1_MONBE|nr:uncharacterized protein MONBRDRAFT_33770 [Monosiga brevicollis MX1]EDQ86494.1 predicted protein [Monosiga brevicollis MX1]|eukprot:XP_001748607.1 hypothetical protein [Monosiga brevicollis MX1]
MAVDLIERAACSSPSAPTPATKLLQSGPLARGLFLARALQKILAEKDTKRSQNTPLREACEAALEQVSEKLKASGQSADENVDADTPMPPPGDDLVMVAADKYFTPFRLACECKSAKVTRTALDCLQKMMAYGHINSHMMAEVEGFPDAMRLVDLVVETICKCFVGEATDESVQLQIIKALLTAVTSNVCDIHEGTLLRAVRTCYNIYLTSRSAVNQTTAKATLTQMINVIFRRMEDVSDDIRAFLKNNKAGATSVKDADETTTDDMATAIMTAPDTHSAAAENGATPAAQPEAAGVVDGAAVEAKTEALAVVQRVVSDIVERAINPPGSPTDEADQSDKTEPAALGRQGSERALQDPRYGHVYRKDAFLVLRSMCKLSMKDLPAKEIDAKSHELRSKILSLELQLAILQSAGDWFRQDPLFIDGIKQYLCVALSKNGVSHVPEVFELALAIFMMLLTKFKQYLKMQIEVFLKDILFSMLETSLSSFRHKWLVVVTLSKIARDKQTVIDLYLNYDCDEYLANVLERMINNLSRVAQGRASSELGASPQQESNMKVKGVECLASLMRCLDEWSRPLFATDDDSRSEADAVSESDADAADSAARAQADEALQFAERKQKKAQREAGITLFNNKPRKGIKYLIENHFLEDTDDAIAEFLHSEERLDRTAIGEYLGEGDARCIRVMHRYIDLIDFSRHPEFLSSLRFFLGSFRLPGESQKIDRLMEKFAARYYELHKAQGVFASADAAYVLAFSVIMLTTDLHSSKVKNKITKEGFLNMTRGINDNRDLPRDFVEGIFDDIAREEIKLKGKSGNQRSYGSELQNATPRVRAQLYHEERKNLEASAEEAMTKAHAGRTDSEFLTATQSEHVKPLFQTVWTSLMAGFTVPLNESNDTHVIDECLLGLRLCIHIACIFDLQLEREAFVPALAKFTNLNNFAEIRPKNVEAVRCILDVGIHEGDYLGASWKDILTCVSQLELAQLTGSSNRRRSEYLSETASQDIVVAADKIFTSSKKLDGKAVVEFVRALCEVSIEELTQHTPPRMYSLTKTVEIAYYNMERIRLEWAHIWAIMGEYFNRVGCMTNEDVAFFAVDSLRQLSIKFLEKGELANYSFQKDFLRPFEYIMSHNKSVKLRDMVVRCVANMVQSKANNIRSGWKNMFFVFSLAASDSDQNIVNLAFTTTKHIFENYFSKTNDHRASLIAASFMDAVNCLSEFACNSHFPELSMDAIRQLRLCASAVADMPELFTNPQEEAEPEPQIWVRGWFPVLFGLSRIIDRCKLDVRTRALTVMFEIMKTYGEQFLAQWWTDLFRVVFRIFDGKKLHGMTTAQERNEWMSTTCTHALRSIVDVVSQFFDTLQECVLPDLLKLLEWSILQESEQLARTGAECLHILVMSNGFNFTDASWSAICDCLKSLFTNTKPVELIEFGAEQQRRARERAEQKQRVQQKQQASEAQNSSDANGKPKGPRPSGDVGGVEQVQAVVAEGGADTKSTAEQSSSKTEAGGAPADKSAKPAKGGAALLAEAADDADATPLPKRAAQPQPNQQALFSKIIIKCVVQLELIQTVEWIVLSSTRPESEAPVKRRLHVPSLSQEGNQTALNRGRYEQEGKALAMPLDQAGEMFACLTSERLLILLGCLVESYQFAHDFNANDDLRTALWEAGFMRNRSKPNLLKQETTALSCSLRILFRLYETEDRREIWPEVEERINEMCSYTLKWYLAHVGPDTREIWLPIINLILREMLAMSDERFQEHAARHFSSVIECVTVACDSSLGVNAVFLAAFFSRCGRFKIL